MPKQQKQGGGGKMPDRERGRPALWQKTDKMPEWGLT
jgi:hypothetical protein